jgi:hypothetical protein
MNTASRIPRTAEWLAAGTGFVVAFYAAYVALVWIRYGRPANPPSDGESDPMLDRFTPEYEVAERHSIRIASPAGEAYAAGCQMDLSRSVVVRTIFRTREVVLRAAPPKSSGPGGLLAQTKVLGWGVLAEIHGREIVMGAVPQPWAADVIFRSVPPEAFAPFKEPGYAKIVWTLCADPDGPTASIHRTETRVSTTEAVARAKFLRYWAVFSPGIGVIRLIGLRLAGRGAEKLVEERNGGSMR